MNKFLSCAKRVFFYFSEKICLFLHYLILWLFADEWKTRAKHVFLSGGSKTLFMKFSASIIVCFWIRFSENFCVFFSISSNSWVEILPRKAFNNYGGKANEGENFWGGEEKFALNAKYIYLFLLMPMKSFWVINTFNQSKFAPAESSK